MLYGEELHVIDAAIGDASLATAIELQAATGEILAKTMVVPCTPLYFGYWVTVTFNYDTQVTEGELTLYKYPAGDASSKVALDTIKLTEARAQYHAYAVLVNQVPNVATIPAARALADCEVGDVLAVWITTQAAGGTEVGDFQPFIIVQHRGENLVNQANFHIVTE